MRFDEVQKVLRDAGIEDWRTESRILAEEICGVSAASLLADGLRELGDKIEKAVRRRCAGEPLQYVIGEWEFCGLHFFVREGCLIPRDDTEVLVRRAVELIPQNSVFADICSGSGCIGISVLKQRTDLMCVSYDLYDVPLELTQKNAEKNGVSERLSVRRADVLCDFDLPKEVSFVLSNPPYIRSDIIPTLGRDVLREPHSALDGGTDGLVFYRAILDLCMRKRLPCLLEIGYDQGGDLRQLCRERGLDCTVIKDLNGNDRVAEVDVLK